MASLMGETVSLTVNFSNFGNDVDLFTTSFVVGAGFEVSGQAVSYTFQSGGFDQTMSGAVSIDVDADGFHVTFAGTAQPGALTFRLESLADESAGAVSSATQSASSGTMAGVTSTLTLAVGTADGGFATGGFFLNGFQPGVSLSQTVDLVLEEPNNSPTAGGIPTDVAATEDLLSNLDLSAISFADAEGDALTVTLAASAGAISATSGGSVTVGGSGTGTLTLAGSAADINTFLDTASNIRYLGAANVNGDNAATIAVSADDGTNDAALGMINVDITAANDAPTASGVPIDVSVVEDTASDLDLSAVAFADIDGDNLSVSLTASVGTMAATSGGGVTVSGSGSNILALSGTASAINTFFDTASNVQYTSAPDANGDNAALLVIRADDGTVNPTLGLVNIDIAAANDAPAASGIPADVAATEDVATDLDLSAVAFADEEGDNLLVSLAASAGLLEAVSGGGVVIGGSGSGTLTLAGAITDIHAFLDTASNVRYIGATDANGDNAATISLSADDSFGDTALGSINIDITAVEDDAVLRNDALLTTETGVLSGGSVFADNGSGADIDVDTALAVTAVNGDAALVGAQAALASGALLTLNSDGTFSYDTNGVFEHVPLGQTATDSFTYSVGGQVATATVTISGEDNRDVFTATNAVEHFDGGVGLDVLSYADSDAGVTVTLLDGVGTTGFAAGDTTTGIESVAGSDFNDVLTGTTANNALRGGAGNDILRPYQGADFVDGGSGTDILDYTYTAIALVISLNTGEVSRVDGYFGLTCKFLANLYNIEMVRGTFGNDEFRANLDVNTSLYGYNGDDTLIGFNGADRLIGGNGNDRLSGGNAADRLSGEAGEDVFFATDTMGVDRVMDWEDGADRLDFGAVTGVSSFADVNVVTGSIGAYVWWDEPGNGFWLVGQATNVVDASDFIF